MKLLPLLFLAVAANAQELTADEVRGIVAQARGATGDRATIVVVDRPG